jgi:hypothetical protein
MIFGSEVQWFVTRVASARQQMPASIKIGEILPVFTNAFA